MSDVVEDARLACRDLCRARSFTLAIVGVLAMAVAANATAVSLLHAVVFRGLPIDDAERLVVIDVTDERGQTPQPIFHAEFEHLRALPPFESLAMYVGGGLLWIEARGVTGEGFIEAVTPGFHESLGLAPHLGRFIDERDAPGESAAAAVTVISHRFWQRYYAGAPEAIGEALAINGVPYTVIGILPPRYTGLHVESTVDYAVPLGTLGRQLVTNQYPFGPDRPLRTDQLIGRLRAGYDLRQAGAILEAAWPALRASALPAAVTGDERRNAISSRIRVASVQSGFSRLRTRYGERLQVFAGITFAFLLTGAVNAAGLVSARAAWRRRELALHSAMGASVGRQRRRAFTEGLVLAATGTGIGLLAACWAAQALGAFLWDGVMPLALPTRPSPIVMWSFAGLSVVVGGVLALPGWAAAHRAATAHVRADVAPSSAPGSIRWLVAAQVAVSFVLAALAVMLTTTLLSLGRLDHGVDGADLRWTRLLPQPGGYQDIDESAYYPELVRGLRALPGIEAVALSHHFPSFFNFGNQVATYPMGPPGADEAGSVTGMMEYVSPDFFVTIGVPFITGRDFRWSDDGRAPAVVIVNESLSRAVFGDADAVGRRLRIGADDARQVLEVIAVVRDATMGDYRRPHHPTAFRPRTQEPRFMRRPVVVFRSRLPAAEADALISEAVARPGREYVRRMYGFDEQIGIALFEERLGAGVAASLAVITLLLTGAGLLAQLSLLVAARRRELAVHLAVGASPRQVAWRVIRHAGETLLIGVVLGAVGVAASRQWLRSWSASLGDWNPVTLLAVAAFFAAIGVAAAAYPAWQAARTDPAVMLRRE